MAKSFEFFFDYVSPTAYLASFLVRKVAGRTGAELIYRPMFLGGVMQATGNAPPGRVPAKSKYLHIDLQRCAAHIGVPLHFNPAFPMMTLRILRATLGFAGDSAARDAFIEACFRYSWGVEEPRNLATDEEIARMCEAEGFETEQILAWGRDTGLKSALKANTEEAVARGAFGAPTFFIGDEIFFGHDRLDYVERALGS